MVSVVDFVVLEAWLALSVVLLPSPWWAGLALLAAVAVSPSLSSSCVLWARRPQTSPLRALRVLAAFRRVALR
jgi:hypothetical protein